MRKSCLAGCLLPYPHPDIITQAGMQTKGFLSERSTATKNRTKEKKHKECLVEITAVRYTSGDELVVLVVAVINYPPNHDLRWLISGCRYHIFGGWNTTLHIGQSSEGDMKGRWESTLTLRTVKDKCKLPLKPFWNKTIIKQNPILCISGPACNCPFKEHKRCRLP